ncbi:MAG TPA: GNAT family N-acetyltransferase, partial [Mycobacteriales bacterium]|nr:GNAT family N-acetyltransferase [Mycobacteriales bacterium]
DATQRARPLPEVPPLDDPDRRAQGHARLRAALSTDPDGCWVAEDDEGLAGVTLALRRDSYWILSLLAVRVGAQGLGIGRLLMDAALRSREGARNGLILASGDPRALRRYHAAGFALHAGFEAAGPVDRALIPAGLRVRDVDLATDLEPLQRVVQRLRGARFGPELATLAQVPGRRVLVTDGPARGFVLLRPGGVLWLAADDEAAAARLLWAAIAECGETAAVEWLTNGQQWAIDVAMQARLSFWRGNTVCRWGEQVPFHPYLPSGVYG